MALIVSSEAPLLLLDDQLRVIAASDSFRRNFDLPTDPVGVTLTELGDGEWNVPQLNTLLRSAIRGLGPIDAYEMDLVCKDQDPRRLVLRVHNLDYGDPDNIRIVLSVADITEARLAEKLKDDLIREKQILLQELQHRVANSLQIIASVLLQSARKVQSEETRSHLNDAHKRVMSVAALQKQLSVSSASEVQLRPYFTTLCNSIGASMIRDHNQLLLDVSVDDSATTADVSVSLGLIVTELVINALKHAFPEDRDGKIKVDYRSHGPNWTLSVTDNGVGMPSGDVKVKPGLGTNIVQALTSQLQADIKISDAHPGTIVSIAHTQIAAVQSAAHAVSPI